MESILKLDIMATLNDVYQRKREGNKKLGIRKTGLEHWQL